MKSGFPFYIARKISLSRSGSGKSPAVTVAVIAVALSTAVMIASIAVVVGFKKAITDKLAGFNSSLTVYKFNSGDNSDNAEDYLTTLTPTLQKILLEQPYVQGIEMELSTPAVFKTDSDFNGVYIKASSGNNLYSYIKENIDEGKMPDFNAGNHEDKIIVSRKTADKLKLHAGDRINTYFFNNGVQRRSLTVSGIYNTHFDAYDEIFAFTSSDMLRGVLDLPKDKGTSIRISTDRFENIEQDASILQTRLNEAVGKGEIYNVYKVESLKDQGAPYFTWLSLLDTNVLVILALMTAVACITLISGMLILVIDKIRMTGILRALGANGKTIRSIFVLLAMRIAIYGLLFGNTIILVLLWIQQKWHVVKLDADSYYIDYIPVEIKAGDIMLLNAAVIAVIFISLLLPAIYASKISPLAAIQTED